MCCSFFFVISKTKIIHSSIYDAQQSNTDFSIAQIISFKVFSVNSFSSRIIKLVKYQKYRGCLSGVELHLDCRLRSISFHFNQRYNIISNFICMLHKFMKKQFYTRLPYIYNKIGQKMP